MLLIVMSIIENRKHILKRKKPLPVRIADRTSFVAMTSTYTVLKGSPWAPSVRINSNLGQLSSFWRHRSNRWGNFNYWIYIYLCNQCLRIRPRQGVLDTTSYDNVCQCLVVCRWVSPGTPVSSTNETDRHDVTEMLLKVVLHTIALILTLIYLIGCSMDNGIFLALCNCHTWLHPRFLVGLVLLNL